MPFPDAAILAFNELGREAISAYEAALLADYHFNLARVRAQAKAASKHKEKPSKDALALLIEADPEFQAAKDRYRAVLGEKLRAHHRAEVAKLEAWRAVHEMATK